MKVVVVLFVLISSNFAHFTVNLFMFKLFKTKLIKIIDQNVLEKECAQDLKSFFVDFNNPNLWALQMLDASGKIYPGLLRGNIHLFGDFDQCLTIRGTDHGRTIESQYCSVIVSVKDEFLGKLAPVVDIRKMNSGLDDILSNLDSNSVLNTLQNKSVSVGVCIPKSCSVRSLQVLVKAVEKSFKLPGTGRVIDDLCLYKDKPVETTQLDSSIYCFFAVVFLLVIGSTIYDLLLRSLGQNSNIFVAFSVFTNLEELFSKSSNDNTLSCLRGIKVLTNMWIIIGHVFVYGALLVKNPIYILTEWKYLISSVFIWNSFYGVETFFTISGLLASYLYLKASERISINLISFYLIRLLRLTPAMMAMVFMNASVLKLLTSGPYGPLAIKSLHQGCQKVWWEFLFYFIRLPNYYECSGYMWYLSIDSQFYLYAPLILFFIKNHPKRVAGGMILASLTGIIYCMVLTINKKLGSTVFDWSMEHVDELYITKFYHVSSWLLGMFLGYLLKYHRKKIPSAINAALWALSLYTMIKLIINKLSVVESQYSVYRSAMWNGFAQPTWSLAVCYIIYSCGTNNGGFINDFLSHYIFKVLGKLTYSMYLIHMPIIQLYYSSRSEANYYNNPQYFLIFLGLYAITIPCSVVLYLGFEAPIGALKNHITVPKKREVSQKIPEKSF